MSIDLYYPFNWRGIEDFKSYDYDEAGLPRVLYSHDLGLRYNPITIAQYGLYSLQQYVNNKKEIHLCRAFACAKWLTEHVQPWRSGILAWIYDYDLYFYGPKAPWISAMAQGEGVSLLLRCYLLQPQDLYLEVARGAIRALDFPVSEGGAVDYLPDGSRWFEEYPTQPPSHVFNGHVFALLGALDFADYFGTPDDWQRCDIGLRSIIKNWRRWDCGYWTRYDLHPTDRLASHAYQIIHIRCMRLLAQRTVRPIYAKVAARWQGMLRNPWCNVRWLFTKIKEKIRLRQFANGWYHQR